jgi:hypothetical protein
VQTPPLAYAFGSAEDLKGRKEDSDQEARRVPYSSPRADLYDLKV